MPSRRTPTLRTGARAAAPDLRLLRTFVALGAIGTMTGAATRLGLTQSAVSQSVRHLEDMVGAILIDRSMRPLALTAAGTLLLRRATALIEKADSLLTNICYSRSATIPELRIGVIDSFGSTVGPGLIKSLLARVSRLTFRSGLATDQSRGLLARELDLIVTSDAMDDVDGLERRPLLSEPFLLLLPSETAARTPYDLKQLASRYPLVRFSVRSRIGAQIERHLRRAGVRAAKTLEVDATDTLTAMVAAGVGWAILPPLCLMQVKWPLQRTLAVPLPGCPLMRQLFLVSRADEYGDLPDEVAGRMRRVISDEVVPTVHGRLPWTKGQLIVG